MKKSLIPVILAAFLMGISKADLIYLEDFQMVGERSMLMLTFHEDSASSGRATLEVKFGEGIFGLSTKVRIKSINDPNKHRAAMGKLLSALNDSKNTYINLRASMQEAGWDMSPPAPEAPFTPPGQDQVNDLDRANIEIGEVYQKLLSTLTPEKQKRLREAQRAWLKSRDAEADRITREGGAVGGSAYREDFANASAKLTRQRTEVLRSYLSNPDDIP